MSWKEFIIQLLSYISWPITVLIVVGVLKNKLSDLLPRIERLKHKDTEIAFSKAIKEVVEKG